VFIHQNVYESMLIHMHWQCMAYSVNLLAYCGLLLVDPLTTVQEIGIQKLISLQHNNSNNSNSKSNTMITVMVNCNC
jgi:hypothetical protein